MSDDQFNADDFARLADAMGLTVEEARALPPPKLTREEQSAQRKAASDAFVFVHPTVESERVMWADLQRASLKAEGYRPEDVEQLTAVAMSEITDDQIIEAWRIGCQIVAERKAEEMRKMVAWQEDQDRMKAAAKATHAHQDRLTREQAATTAETERADKAEWTARGLQSQIDGLLTGQRS